jgi:hypothetical protein
MFFGVYISVHNIKSIKFLYLQIEQITTELPSLA